MNMKEGTNEFEIGSYKWVVCVLDMKEEPDKFGIGSYGWVFFEYFLRPIPVMNILKKNNTNVKINIPSNKTMM